MTFTIVSKTATFGGNVLKLSHPSVLLKCKMSLNVFFPPDNGAQKSYINYWAAKYGIAVVYPDTSPRESSHPGEDDAYDFGSSAGFYVDAVAKPWNENYHMYSYITKELPAILFSEFSILDQSRKAIMGHSMGGHGALSIYLKNSSDFKCCSAFAPIAHPIKCQWGQKCFGGYFGDSDEMKATKWVEHDSTELLKNYTGEKLSILVTCGTADNFLADQLLIDDFAEAATSVGRTNEISVKYYEGYDHSYFYVASAAEEHMSHAAVHLGVA
ncbi:Alpha/Beta hydrolase protein [Dipodascopsis tothii]|uniref:Alpha/Beta hydrolase protein n=1 Tax=Dipodascopsis tothii TaxID=44089 RepID=UPI0034CD2B88